MSANPAAPAVPLDRHAPAARLSVAVGRSESDLDAWPAEWKALGSELPFAPEDERAEAQWTAGFERPHTIVVHEDGTPRLLAVGRIRATKLSLKVGYRRLWSPVRRAIEVRARGIAGDPDERTARAVVASLVDSLRRGEAEIAVLHQLPRASALTLAARRASPWWCRDGAPVENVRWVLRFPEQSDAPLPLSSHTRRLARYYANRLRRTYGDRLKLEVRTGVEDLERTMRDVESVAATTYQRRIGVGFFDDELTRGRIRHLMERGRFRAFVLSIDERPRAFWLGVRTGSLYESQETGYDPAFSRDHVGKVLLAWKLEMLRHEGGIRELDFGFGDAAYKSHHATDRLEEVTLTLFAPTMRGAALNAVRTGIGTVNRVIKATATRLSLFERLRTRQRRRLVERGRTEEGADAEEA